MARMFHAEQRFSIMRFWWRRDDGMEQQIGWNEFLNRISSGDVSRIRREFFLDYIHTYSAKRLSILEAMAPNEYQIGRAIFAEKALELGYNLAADDLDKFVVVQDDNWRYHRDPKGGK